MTYAFCPDDGLPRLMRRVPHGDLGADDLICMLDAKHNVLLLDQKNFDALSKTEKHIVLRTQRPYIAIGDVAPHTRQFEFAAE